MEELLNEMTVKDFTDFKKRYKKNKECKYFCNICKCTLKNTRQGIFQHRNTDKHLSNERFYHIQNGNLTETITTKEKKTNYYKNNKIEIELMPDLPKEKEPLLLEHIPEEPLLLEHIPEEPLLLEHVSILPPKVNIIEKLPPKVNIIEKMTESIEPIEPVEPVEKLPPKVNIIEKLPPKVNIIEKMTEPIEPIEQIEPILKKTKIPILKKTKIPETPEKLILPKGSNIPILNDEKKYILKNEDVFTLLLERYFKNKLKNKFERKEILQSDEFDQMRKQILYVFSITNNNKNFNIDIRNNIIEQLIQHHCSFDNKNDMFYRGEIDKIQKYLDLSKIKKIEEQGSDLLFD